MQGNQVSIRSVLSSDLSVKRPQTALASSKGDPETQQEQWCPAPAISYALRGEKSWRNHIQDPSTQELHCSTHTSMRQFKVLLLSSLHIPKSSHADWRLPLTPEGLTDRRGTLHLPDGSIKAAVIAYQHLHKQTSCSNSSLWACFQLLLLWEARVILIIKFNMLIVFSEVLRNLRLRTLATKLQKRSQRAVFQLTPVCNAESLASS